MAVVIALGRGGGGGGGIVSVVCFIVLSKGIKPFIRELLHDPQSSI